MPFAGTDGLAWVSCVNHMYTSGWAWGTDGLQPVELPWPAMAGHIFSLSSAVIDERTCWHLILAKEAQGDAALLA